MKPNAQLQVRSVRAQGARERTGHISGALDAAGGKSGANDGVHSLGFRQTWNANNGEVSVSRLGRLCCGNDFLYDVPATAM
jgi:hypothetical protein